MTSTTLSGKPTFDVFISHASEDKPDFVRPLARLLRSRGVTVWYDEYSLDLGDSLAREIAVGLVESRYGVVVLSDTYLGKRWTQRELAVLLTRDALGAKLVLPVWHKLTKSVLADSYPELIDRIAVHSSSGLVAVADAICTEVAKAPSPASHRFAFSATAHDPPWPLQRLFLHFLDHHFLDSLGSPARPDRLEYEARLALRIALSVASEVLIPASSFVESDLCRSLIIEFAELFKVGRIAVVGGGTSFADYCDRSLEQYLTNTARAERYVAASASDAPPFIKRSLSATTEIAEFWTSPEAIPARLAVSRMLRDLSVTDVDTRWEHAPERLDGAAFIAENVFSIIAPGQSVPRRIQNEVEAVINRAYFGSFFDEFDAGAVIELAYLRSDVDTEVAGASVSYQAALRAMVAERALDDFVNLPPSAFGSPRNVAAFLDLFSFGALRNVTRSPSSSAAALARK